MEKIKKPAQVLLKGPWTVQIKKSLLNRQLKIANIVEAMIKAKHCHASQLALKLVSKNKIMSRKRSIERVIAAKWISPEDNYLLFLSHFKSYFEKQKHITLIIDGTKIKTNKALMISFLYNKKAIPFVWLVEKGSKGVFKESSHLKVVRLATEALQRLGFQGQATLLGDGEFDGSKLRKYLQQVKWDYVLRTSCNRILYEDGDRFQAKNISPKTDHSSYFFIPDVLDEEGLRDNFLASQNNRKKESFYFLTNIDNGHLAKVYSSRH